MKTTGKYSEKLYKCKRCGAEVMIGTNHWGECYPSCVTGMCIGTVAVWECQEQMPEGYIEPTKWKTVKLSEIVDIKQY